MERSADFPGSADSPIIRILVVPIHSWLSSNIANSPKSRDLCSPVFFLSKRLMFLDEKYLRSAKARSAIEAFLSEGTSLEKPAEVAPSHLRAWFVNIRPFLMWVKRAAICTHINVPSPSHHKLIGPFPVMGGMNL